MKTLKYFVFSIRLFHLKMILNQNEVKVKKNLSNLKYFDYYIPLLKQKNIHISELFKHLHII